MRIILSIILLIVCSMAALAQDNFTHVYFANQTDMPITLTPSSTGNTASVSVNKRSFIPFEITHDHSSTIAPGDFIGQPEKDHNESNSSLIINRGRSLGTNNYQAKLDVRTGDDLLFSITLSNSDQSGLFTTVFYNVLFPDGSSDVPSPGVRMLDNSGLKAQVAREIIYKGEAYRLVYGVFDENQDNSDNIIYSLSKVTDTLYRYDPPLEDTLNPDLLHIYCFNPGILMPLEINDQDEIERAEVFYKAMPRNMDVMIFQEFFEPALVRQIIKDLSPWYPYHTGQHNRILINNIGQDGGVRIMSRYPILEEREISFSENGCIPEDFFSLFANKGVKYAKINKQGQMLHVFGTHTSLQPCDLYVMGKFIADMDLPKDEVVIMAGDFNVDMNRFKNGSDDYAIMLDTLNAVEPTYLSFLNDRAYKGTTSGLAHMYCCNPDGRQHLDYVFVSASHKVPSLLTNRSQQARLNEPDASFGIFDMGDHQPIYARIEFPSVKIDDALLTTCSGKEVTLRAQIQKPASGGVVQWFRNNEPIIGATQPELTLTINGAAEFGQYECRYTYTYIPDTVVNNFFDPSYMDYNWIFRGITTGKLSVFFDVQPENPSDSCLGIATSIFNAQAPVFLIYPNPASNILNINVDASIAFDLVELFDASGKVYPRNLYVKQGSQVQVNIQDLSPGAYHLRLTAGGKTSVKTFVKL